MGSLRERPPNSGHWELRVYAGSDRGRDIYISRTVQGTERDARKALSRLEVEVEDRKAPRPGQGTTGRLLEDWWLKKSWQSARSPAAARWNLDRYLLPHLGSIHLVRLTHHHIDRFYAGLLDGTLALRGQPLQPATVRRIHADLHAGLQWGVLKGRLGQNPASRANPPVPVNREVETPEPEHIARLIDRAPIPEFSLFVELAAGTGRRREDLLGLQFRDLRFDEGAVVIARRAVQVGKQVIIEHLDKNKRAVRLSVTDQTLGRLQEHSTWMHARAVTCGTRLSPRSFVFSDHPDACTPWKPNAVSNRFARLADRCELGRYTLHSLRHAHITELLVDGVDIETVAHRVGDDPRTIYKTYSHFRPARDRSAAQAWARIMDTNNLPAR